MTPIAFPKAERLDLAARLRALLAEEFEVELSGLQTEMLVDRLAETLGPAFYNRGVADARDVLAARVEDLTETLYGLERSLPGVR